MKPFETIIPARRVQVMTAEIWTVGQCQQLRMALLMGGLIQNITLVGDSLFELIGRLGVELGFSGEDAARIVQAADHPKAAFN